MKNTAGCGKAGSGTSRTPILYSILHLTWTLYRLGSGFYLHKIFAGPGFLFDLHKLIRDAEIETFTAQTFAWVRS